MNLEEGKADATQDVPPKAIDVGHWEWMSQYRVWEANRKIFLYPENWTLPELRDNKSQFFQELESELLQNDLTEDTAEQAIMNYLEKLDQVARLEICGMYSEDETDPRTGRVNTVLHVFGRTFNTPHVYFYRRLAVTTGVWTAWEKVPVDIQGDHLVPVVWNRHLYVFWPVFEEKSDKEQDPGAVWVHSEADLQSWRNWKKDYDQWTNDWAAWNTSHEAWIANYIAPDGYWAALVKALAAINVAAPPAPTEPIEPRKPQQPSANPPTLTHWEIKLAWSEYKHNKWTAKQTSSEFITSRYVPKTLQDVFLNGTYLEKLALSTGQLPFTNNYAYPPFDTVVQVYLPSQKEHFLKTSIESDQVVVELYRRYSVEFPVFGLFKGGVLESFDTLGRFRTGCGTKVKADDTEPQSQPFDSFAAPDGATNSFMTLADNSGATALTFYGDAILPSIPSAHYDLLIEHKVGQFTFTGPFFYQDGDRTYYVGLWGNFETFFHPYVCAFIEALNRGGVSALLTLDNQQKNDITPFPLEYSGPQVTPPYPYEGVDFSSDGAYSLYNWELFFHIPLLIATRLSQNQRFEEARRWFHYIFNPTNDSPETPPQCFWNVLPFHDNTEDGRIQDLLESLDYDGKDPAILKRKSNFQEQIREWRLKPFDPHLIARLRLSAYQKTVVMKYNDNLIAWGDYLFSQDTMESVNQAIQLYVLAYEILGPRPQQVPERGTVQVRTYHDLRPKLDDFSNALVELENEFPFTTIAASNQLSPAEVAAALEQVVFI